MTRSVYRRVAIPTDQSFLKQWHLWVRSKVSKRFKRDKERIPDTTQRVCVRLLQKEFIGRWFFKHLKEELVDLAEAERLLVRRDNLKDGSVVYSNVKVALVGKIPRATVPGTECPAPAGGVPRGWERTGKETMAQLVSTESRSSASSLWRVSDLLRFADFNHQRFFYSMQGHTIDSDKVLTLLNYPAGNYGVLQSMWRQGRLVPSELTEHECPRRGLRAMSPTQCPECVRGLALLRSKGVTLDLTRYPEWTDERIVAHVKKMRWNDSQLSPFLRRWHGNFISGPPRSIMRPVAAPSSLDHVLTRDLNAYIDLHFDELSDDVQPAGIDAGLLKYANTVVDNEVINDFKTLSRTDDVSRMVLNNGMSPESADGETVAFDLDAEDGAPKIACDTSALSDFDGVEHRSDIQALLEDASLSDEERSALEAVDLMEMSVQAYAARAGVPTQKVHRWRSSAFRKLKRAGHSEADKLVADVCRRHGCSRSELFSSRAFGPVVLARTDLFSALAESGMSESDIAAHFDYPRERVAAAIQRASRSRPPSRSSPSA